MKTLHQQFADAIIENCGPVEIRDIEFRYVKEEATYYIRAWDVDGEHVLDYVYTGDIGEGIDADQLSITDHPYWPAVRNPINGKNPVRTFTVGVWLNENQETARFLKLMDERRVFDSIEHGIRNATLGEYDFAIILEY